MSAATKRSCQVLAESLGLSLYLQTAGTFGQFTEIVICDDRTGLQIGDSLGRNASARWTQVYSRLLQISAERSA